MHKTNPWQQQLIDFIAENFLAFAIISLTIITILCLACLLLMCYCKKREKLNRFNNENRRGLLGMFAKLDEFESLTPLIVTPGSTPSASKLASPATLDVPSTSRPINQSQVCELSSNHLSPRIASMARPSIFPDQRTRSSSKQPTALTPRSPVLTSSDSPPPPRKNLAGKTLIVPLGSNNNNRTSRSPLSPFVPVLGTPDSRVTSFEAGTTKSCATIPEDDELALESDNGEPEKTYSMDLVSIDRTYGSLPAPIRINPTNANSIIVPPNVPEFKVLTPCYTPPEPPTKATPSNEPSPRGFNRAGYTSSRINDSTNLSSPEGSSCGLESPIDTTNSLSDSFLMPSEGDNDSRARVYYIEIEDQTRPLGTMPVVSEIDSDARMQLPPLQKIEEESEHLAESSIAHSATGANLDGNTMPRSISQQLAMMHHEKERRVKANKPENQS